MLVVSIEKTSERHLDKLVKTAIFRERIRVLKNISFAEMYNYLSASDIGVVPWPEKYYTSLPVKVFDYLAAGLPVIIKGPKQGALREFYKKNPFIGKYIFSWKAFLNTFNDMVKNLSRTKNNFDKRVSIIKTKWNRKKGARKAFRTICSLINSS